MVELSGVPREYLFCRAFAHTWDHGPAPVQREPRKVPETWVTRGRCTSCGMKRWQWLAPGTCKPQSDWAYEPPEDFTRHLHLVTKPEARTELARRDQVGGKRYRKAG